MGLVRLLSHRGSFPRGRFLLPMGASPIPRAPGGCLPGGRREQEFLIGVEGIRSPRDILYHSLTNHTNYPARILPSLRQHPINRATPRSFLPPQLNASTARAIPTPLPQVSLPRTTLLQTRRTISNIQTNRTTPRRTQTRTITNPLNRLTITNA